MGSMGSWGSIMELLVVSNGQASMIRVLLGGQHGLSRVQWVSTELAEAQQVSAGLSGCQQELSRGQQGLNGGQRVVSGGQRGSAGVSIQYSHTQSKCNFTSFLSKSPTAAVQSRAQQLLNIVVFRTSDTQNFFDFFPYLLHFSQKVQLQQCSAGHSR